MKTLTYHTYRIFWEHAKKYKLAIFLLVIGMVGATVAEVYAPTWYQKLFNTISLNDPTKFRDMVVLIFWAWVTHMVAWFFWRVATFTNNFFQPRVMSDLVNTCFRYLHDHSYNFFNNNFAGSLLKRVTRYERSFENIADQLFWHFGQTALRLLFVLGVLFFVNWTFAAALIIWVIVYLYFQFKFSDYKLKFDVEKADLDTRVSGRIADTITNNINLKLFSGFWREVKSFEKLNNQLYKLRKFTWDLASLAEGVQAFMMIALELIMLYMALSLWRAGTVQVGDFILVQLYLTQIFGRLWDTGRHIRQVYEALADAEEMTEILITSHEVRDPANAKKLAVRGGAIEFKNVTFAYHKQKNTYKNFNLKINPGERVALIGPSGGGKSTIVKLLFRFFDIQSGQILIDDQNIAEVQQVGLRDNISLVPQDPILFHRTLMENIRYAKAGASDQEVARAAKLAHAHEFISSFPEGYDTYVGERGVKLSGGERQRVAIARAILKDAPILVLDEATSSLDSESESLIQDALKNLMKGRTTIVIAHRLSTIMQMDRIIVIDGGKVVEEGKHEELLKAKQGVYQRLWEIQAGGFA